MLVCHRYNGGMEVDSTADCASLSWRGSETEKKATVAVISHTCGTCFTQRLRVSPMQLFLKRFGAWLGLELSHRSKAYSFH